MRYSKWLKWMNEKHTTNLMKKKLHTSFDEETACITQNKITNTHTT